jgi:hypothetical protein
MAKRGRAAVSLPPLPMKFKEAVADYLKINPPTEPPTSTKTKRAAKRKRKAR